ncbi:UNVERIFIED_CONTAM: Mediator of RNA polymerase II transcription subunitA [Sesamum radiatum]|uniref:Mediator of RNA polymerase II transcription subunitA n=1 Tax=Sesamum radiatum TaxID=300843 RepID=A0AAW2S867_SESRA
MEVDTQLNYNVWDRVLGQTKEAQEKGSDPLLWAIQVSSNLSSAGIALPSLELANHLVSHICWDNNVPISWKFLEKALALKIVPPLLVLGLLSTRVIPYRHSCPAAFRLYMELLKRHAFSLKEYTNLPNYQKSAHWKSFIQRMQLLVENSLALRNSKSITPEVLLQLISDSHKVKFQHFQASLLQEFHPVVQSRPLVNLLVSVLGLVGLVKSLQALNATSWHEIFLGLWMAALRLVQRERDPIEGPVPRLDTRLSMLLSITTLVVADLVEEEESIAADEFEYGLGNKHQVPGKRRMDLICSLQNLHDYQSLLTPPQSAIPAANQAAAKAMMFVSGINVGTAYFECISTMDMPINCSGNLYHLIVEACIARNLLDTSAYFWPAHGFNGSFAEVEKVFEMAVKGSNEERITAATILCGASLIRGWNIQEHTIYFITRLLSPPVPVDYTGNESHLISYAPMLNVLLVGIAPVDCVQIFSLHGLVPELAGSLMTICEVFGSCVPNISWTMTTGEEISAHAVFSNAFALLLKLWRFNHPPIEYGVGDVPPVGSQLTPEYLLLVRNSHLVSSGNLLKDPNRRRLAKAASSSSPKPIFVDSFPKLKVWYRQHLACIASPLTGLVNGTPVHHTVDTLLNMMFRKIGGGNQTVTTVTSGSSSSSGPGSEDIYLRPKLPAWDILEAVPFVADAALTACAHGRLSPRELCTGLKDLADFLPATLATIVSYFSAEVTRGVWKSVFMNGTDWPSPAANLSNVEGQIKKILAATGVDIPSLAAGGSSPASLPLPLAAFVSLTITYKLDKASQRFLDLAGPALESLAAGCPWPCMPIVASLWTQKAKRWSDFLVFSASRTVFLHSNDAVVQLLRSCFSATLGLNSSCCISSNGGIGALLGHGFGSHFNGDCGRRSLWLPFKTEFRKAEKVKNGMKHGHASLAATLTKVKLAASLGASVIFLTGGLGLVQSLIKETLPSWFMSIHRSEQEGERGKMLPMLRGYALAYLAALCGAFVWGVDSATTAASKRRPKILGCHMEFLASALDGKISLGCDLATWHAYVSGFLSLMVRCTPTWIFELNVELLRRLSKGLRRWNEEELALALLGVGGLGTMSAAAEMVIETEI